jgi:hypothetical protein
LFIPFCVHGARSLGVPRTGHDLFLHLASLLPSAAIRGNPSPQLANPWLFRMGRKPKLLLPIGHLQFHDLTETFAWVISFASSKPESKFR